MGVNFRAIKSFLPADKAIAPSLFFATSNQIRLFAAAKSSRDPDSKDRYKEDRVSTHVGHNFPDFIEHWGREPFRKVGYGLSAATGLAFLGPVMWWEIQTNPVALTLGPGIILGALTALYWRVGLQDIEQTSHAVRRNFPVLGNIRYILESIRPELRQYIVEDDNEGRPFGRMHRSQIYQRAKAVDDTLPFGTRRDVYAVHHEWANHSMWPVKIVSDDAKRHWIGAAEYGTTQPYNASILNISGMSYGAISDNAILALNQGAKYGNFWQNTGEGGVSKFHRQATGNLVWNVGTGYFGCGSGSGENRVFEPDMMKETIDECAGQIKMIEIKLSQGAKPGHGGLLPRVKISKEIAETRKLDFPATGDCHSPARHSSFNNAHEMILFISKVRELSGGLPVGVKLCVGNPGDFAEICRAMVAIGNGPDFITVDGAEGGTGAAPPEFSNSVGLPLEEGLVTVRNLLVGAGLKDKTMINASGRVATAFSIIRLMALGADVTSAARAFMMSIGCIQALKCNSNKCPTGIATLDKKLMYGLDPTEKSYRVYNFHNRTVEAATDMIGAMGKARFSEVTGNDIMRRCTPDKVCTLSELFPEVEPGCLLDGSGSSRLQAVWDGCEKHTVASKRFIY